MKKLHLNSSLIRFMQDSKIQGYREIILADSSTDSTVELTENSVQKL
jgi:hypothetical protein